MAIWAFAKVTNDNARSLVYKSILAGRSRFGWSSLDTDNVRTNWIGRQMFLKNIKQGDWVVHINMPEWGKCVAAKVIGEFEFDRGIKCEWGIDFRSSIPIDINTILEFDRQDPNILPKVNLNPRQRYHRIWSEDDFEHSIENLKNNSVNLKNGQTKEIFHLHNQTKGILSNITELLHNTHRSKYLEDFFAAVFRRIPNVVDVIENGYGWRTDNGADLIITLNSSISNIVIENKIVVQVKSYGGEHYDLTALDQIVTAIKHYDAIAGIIITTAEKTEKLEDAVQEASNKIEKSIDLIAGSDVAMFVLKHAPELIFDMEQKP